MAPTTQQLQQSIQAGINMHGSWVEHNFGAFGTGGNQIPATGTGSAAAYNTALQANVPSITGNANTPDRVQIYLDNTLKATLNPLPSPLAYTFTGLSSGVHYGTIRFGNSTGYGPSSVYFTVTV